MSIYRQVGASHVMPIMPERAEGPGPDTDGDSDAKGVVNTAPVQPAPTAASTGSAVNKVA